MKLIATFLALITVSIGAHAATISPDGTTLTPTQINGSVTTKDGTWTFGGPATADVGNNLINLTGCTTTKADAVEIEVASGGQLYTLDASGDWYVYTGNCTGWQKTTAPPAVNAPTYSITYTWVPPFQYIDNSAIAAGTPITYGLSLAPNAETPTNPVTGSQAITSTSYTVTGLPAGTYCGSVTATIANISSDPSVILDGGAMCATVPKTNTTQKKPMAPSVVTATVN